MANIAGISTVGVLFGYATGAAATAPSAFTILDRINSIGGLSLEPEQIDASALEDEVSKYISGRLDTGGTISVTVNLTSETMTQLETMISAYDELTGANKMWFEVYNPNLTKGFFFLAQPPKYLPLPETGQNELSTIEIALTVEEYKGWQTAVVPA